jgi:hypothetical protein
MHELPEWSGHLPSAHPVCDEAVDSRAHDDGRCTTDDCLEPNLRIIFGVKGKSVPYQKNCEVY